MKTYYFIVPLLLAAFGAPTVLRADTVTYYLVTQEIDGGAISGTITTDGSMGGFIQIDSYSFGVTRSGPSTGAGGGGSSSEEGKTPSVSEIGTGFTATASGLFFNFDDLQQSALIFRNAVDGFEWCIFTDEACDPPGSGELLSLGDSSGVVTGLSGDVMISSIAPTPEPGIFGFVLIGIAALVMVTRRRLSQTIHLPVERGVLLSGAP
jgi:hypothetical protein